MIRNWKLEIRSILQLTAIVVALTVGLILRIYKIESAIADWHSFRQADTASVTREFVKKGIDLLRPTYHDLSNIQSGTDNPEGYRMVEFPIYNAVTAISHTQLFRLYPAFTIEITSRLVNILLSLGTAILVYVITKNITGKFWPSFASFCFFLFLPFNVFYSRSTLPEPLAVFTMLLTILMFGKHPVLASIPFSVSILTKPYTALLIFPYLLYKAVDKFNRSGNSYIAKLNFLIKLIVFSLISLLPFYFWRQWIHQYPEGVPASNWLFVHNPNDRRIVWWHGYNISWIYSFIPLKPYWWRWLFYERLSKIILGVFAIIPFVLGFAYRRLQTQYFLITTTAGILFYFFIVAGGNIQHDYYQILVIPFISITVGVGLYYLSNYVYQTKFTGVALSLFLFSASLLVNYSQVANYYKINRPDMVDLGAKASEFLPNNALVIAPYNGDTSFLYQINRSGWPTEIYDIDTIKKQHPHNPIYLVTLDSNEYTSNLEKKYKAITKFDQLTIINLNQ